MRYYELLFEAAYDSMITSMLSKYPDYADAINWAKQSNSLAKRQDRVVWYLRQVRNIIEADTTYTARVIETKKEDIETIQEELDHYLLQEIPKINSYIFSNEKNLDVTFNELRTLENEYHKQQKSNAVPIKKGDYKLIEYPDGSNWWFVNRAYCKDEGRSGHHCGNVEGKRKSDQRILSYRDKNGNVLLTFILHSDGSLGEMKARYNRKPESKYHKVIVDLLSTNLIKNIKSGGFLPENNFSISDLEAKNIETLYKTKPKLIYDSIIKDPTIILKLPKEILNNQKFVDSVSRSKKGKDIINLVRNPSTINWIMYLLDDGDKSTKLKAWYSAPLAAKKATNELLVDNIYNNITSFDYEDENAYDINTDIKWPKEFRTPDIGKKVLDRLLTGDESWWDPVLLQVIKIAYPNLNTDQSEQDDLLSYFASKKSNMSITTGKWAESTKKFFDEHPNLKNEFFDRLLLLLTRPQNQSFEYFAPRFSKAVGKKLDVDNISVKDFLYVLNKIPGPIVGDMNRGDYHLIEYFNTKNLAKAISLLDEEKLRKLIPIQYSFGGNQLGYLFTKADLNTTKKFIKNIQNAYQSNETTLNRFLENFLSAYLDTKWEDKSNVDEDIIGLWYKLTNELPYRYTQYEDMIPKRVILDVINNNINLIYNKTFIKSVLKIWKNDEDVMQALRQKGVKIKDLDK